MLPRPGIPGLAYDNAKRVVAGEGSPKILVGGITLGIFPNFHIGPMIEMGASLVGISAEPKPNRPDLLYVDPTENLAKVLDRLPAGWRPDFFLDLQAEHGHWLPVGVSELPFPSVVTFNHAHLEQVLWHMRGMFDCVVAPSAMMARWGDAWLPWSGSWGTMDWRIADRGCSYTGEAKDVTVSCPMSLRGVGSESVRHAVFAEIRKIKERRPGWKVEIVEGGLELQDYYRLLARSRVVVNVGTWGSPVGYRPLEAIAQGAVLVHIDETAYGSNAKLSEVFDHTWFVETDAAGLEDSIERGVARSRMGNVVGMVKAHLETRYSYERQYRRLFEIAGRASMKERLSLRDWSRRAFAIGHLTGFHDNAFVHAWALHPRDWMIEPGYRDAVNLWQPENLEERWQFQTDLALGEDPEAVYERHAALALGSHTLAS